MSPASFERVQRCSLCNACRQRRNHEGDWWVRGRMTWRIQCSEEKAKIKTKNLLLLIFHDRDQRRGTDLKLSDFCSRIGATEKLRCGNPRNDAAISSTKRKRP